MPGDVLTVSIDARDEVTVLFLDGEVDALSVGELDSALHKSAQRRMPVIIDVSNLGYIDSSAFRVIYQISEHIATSIVVAPGSVLSRTIRLAGIGSRIPISPDIDAARALWAGGRGGDGGGDGRCEEVRR
jgi:anti-sigma B factor antagonist